MLFILQVFISRCKFTIFFVKKAKLLKKNCKVNPSLTVSTVQRVKRLKIHNHRNNTIDFTFFSKKGVVQ